MTAEAGVWNDEECRDESREKGAEARKFQKRKENMRGDFESRFRSESASMRMISMRSVNSFLVLCVVVLFAAVSAMPDESVEFAFFTKRRTEALEELTWDYGIHFDDRHHCLTKASNSRFQSQYSLVLKRQMLEAR